MQEEKNETDIKIATTKELLKNLQSLKSLAISLKKLTSSDIQSMSRPKSPIMNPLQNHSITAKNETYSSAPILSLMSLPAETRVKSSNSFISNLSHREEIEMPKNLTPIPEEFLSSNCLVNNLKRAADAVGGKIPLKKRKINITLPITQTDVELHSNITDGDVLSLKQEIFASIAASLEIKYPCGFINFYRYLFQNMFLNIQAKPEPKLAQDQFTCLRLADLFLNFTKLSENYLNPDQIVML